MPIYNAKVAFGYFQNPSSLSFKTTLLKLFSVIAMSKMSAPKEKKPKQSKTASHPPYFQMIKEALVALNEKGGSSPHAIGKYMEDKFKAVLPANFRKILALQLKNQAAKGNLLKIKASYKLSGASKKNKKEISAPAKAMKKKRISAPAKAMEKNQSRSVKKTKKVSTPAKPKQPKSLKSPAKRSRKGTAAA
ncbi:hypothetical protein PIB30_011026 [Stylosanthes scabra]|uniref:H15 domain-containing protein n=1 Tax=Stylosanthes scabra TaxID=79078 RepID=A0ABU6W554_9FABA|nr:hypothetical protein [Stylosanthes scabra]